MKIADTFLVSEAILADCQNVKVGRDVAVVTATRYRLEGLGIDSRWGGGARFFTPVQTSPWAHLLGWVPDHTHV